MKKKNRIFAAAVVVAAGRGSRMNMDINKQYVDVCGKPVIARTLQAFEDCRLIDEIVLVVNENDIFSCKQGIVDRFRFNKVTQIVSGGDIRQESVFKGLREVSAACGIVLIHDGARPFVDEEIIKRNIHAVEEFGAACTAVPVKDTIKASDPEGFISETFDRSILWSVQTPQSFRYELILNAHKRALEEQFTGTDDSTLAERIGYKVRLVMGSYDNIKITTREDLAVAEAIALRRADT
jgi:2-C-methyl-D-erythritol 4-phosphate cytidylyltransferase